MQQSSEAARCSLLDVEARKLVVCNYKGNILRGHRDAAGHLWNGRQAQWRKDEAVGLVASNLHRARHCVSLFLNVVQIKDESRYTSFETAHYREEVTFIKRSWCPATEDKVIRQVALRCVLIICFQGCNKCTNSIDCCGTHYFVLLIISEMVVSCVSLL